MGSLKQRPSFLVPCWGGTIKKGLIVPSCLWMLMLCLQWGQTEPCSMCHTRHLEGGLSGGPPRQCVSLSEGSSSQTALIGPGWPCLTVSPEESSVLFGSWSRPPGLGSIFCGHSLLSGGAQVTVVGLQWRSWPAARKSSGNWVTGVSQLMMHTFSIPFGFLMQGLMNSAHYTSRVGELQEGMALKGRSIYSLPLDRKVCRPLD